MAPLKSGRSSVSILPFFVLRFLALVCSSVVLGILAFFVAVLRQDKLGIPWEFLILDLVALLALLNIFATSIVLIFGALRPGYFMVTEAMLTVLWAISFGLLAKAMGKTATETCNVGGWGNDDGVKVCQRFKALFAFALLAIFVSFASFVLGVIARKRSATHHYEPTSNPANLSTTRTSYISMHSNADSTYGAPPSPPAHSSLDPKRPYAAADSTYGAPPSPPAHSSLDPTRPYAAADSTYGAPPSPPVHSSLDPMRPYAAADSTYGAPPSPPAHSSLDPTRPYAAADSTYGAPPSPPAHSSLDPTRPYAAAVTHHHQNPNYYD